MLGVEKSPLFSATFCVLSIATMVLFNPIQGSDADVLLALRSSANAPFPSWNASNPSSYCQWERVQCDGDGRVTHLFLNGNTTYRPLRGTLPPNFAQLTQLKVLRLSNNDLIGLFPIQFFQSPVFGELTLVSTGFTVILPPILSPSITLVDLSDTQTNVTSFSEMNWPNVTSLTLTSTYYSCPLPEGLVNFSRAGGRIHTCIWRSGRLHLDNSNFLCGQIHVSNFSCDLGPLWHLAENLPQNVRPSSVDFRVEFGRMTIEFIKDEILFFAAYNRSSDGLRNEFRGEYISIRVRPMNQLFMTTSSYGNVYTFNQTRFHNFVWESESVLRVNMTIIENLQFEIVFLFNASRRSAGNAAIKFSFVVYNLGYVWRAPLPGIDTPMFSINLVLNYKLQHSLGLGSLVDCPPGGMLFKECRSAAAYIFTAFDLNSGEHLVSASTNRTEMSLSYPAEGIIDGRILGGVAGNMVVHGARMPWPLPSADFLSAYSVNNQTPPIYSVSTTDQALVIPIQLTVPRVLTRLDYDPDVSISLLFDPDSGLPPTSNSSPGQADNIANDVQAAVVVGVVVAAVVVAGLGIFVFAKVVFPFLQKRKASSLASTEIDEPEVNKLVVDQKQVWRRSAKPASSSTIQ